MFQSAKYFPIKDQIFEFDIIKWPNSREAIPCGINNKYYVFVKNFVKCFYNSNLNSKKSADSNDHSFLFILLTIIFLSLIHLFLIKSKFYDFKRPKDQDYQENSNNSKNKIDVIHEDNEPFPNNTIDTKRNSGSNYSANNLRDSSVVFTRIQERKSNFFFAIDKDRSRSSSPAALYTKISEIKIERAKISKKKPQENKETENQTDCYQIDQQQLPLAITNINS